MKRYLSVILILCLVISMIPAAALPVFAADSAQTDTEEGDTIVQTQEETLWEYEAYSQGIVLTAYTGTATDVYVPSMVDDHTVVKLADGLFRDNDSLNSVTLGTGIEEIGAQCFYDCDNLVCIVTNEELTAIGAEAFYSCDVFNSIILYDAVTTIGENVFANCPEVTVWCNESTAAYTYATENSIACQILNPDATPETYVQDGITYYIMNGEAIAIDFDESTTEVVLPAVVEGYPVTQLRETFTECRNLESVALSEGIKIISSNTFYNCLKLSAMWIPSSVTSIGANAFYNCLYLSNVTIGNNVTTIGDYAFYNCDSLTCVTIPDSVTGIGQYTFNACGRLASVVIGDGVTEIGEKVFQNCSSLSEVTIGQSVTNIGRFAFNNCTNLSAITIPGNVASLGASVFSGCTGLTSAVISEGVTAMGSFAFHNCSSLTAIKLPSTMTSIKNGTFYNCGALSAVEIPAGITSIGDYAFYECGSLTSITFPDTLISIGSGAFGECFGLSKAVIPESVESLEKDSFLGNCILLVYENSYAHKFAETNSLMYMIFDGVNEPLILKQNGITFCVINGEAVALDFDESATQVVIPASVEGYPVTDLRETFRDCTSLTSVTIPDSVTNIGQYAFENCSSLISVNIPDGVTSIGNYAFSGCSSLNAVTIPSKVAYLGISAFAGCSGLTSVSIPTSVTVIENYTFSGCSSLAEVTLPETLTKIGINAFYNCDSLAAIMIPDIVMEIGNKAFYSCDALTSVTIGKAVSVMGEEVFYQCSNLSSVRIEDGATCIGVSAFKLCTSLQSVKIPDSVTSIGNSAFSNCYALTSVTIGDGVTSIEYSTFQFCESLSTVIIGSSVTSIGDAAFSDCDSLTAVTIPEGVTSIAGYAFDCANLSKVIIPQSVTSLSSGAFPATTILLVYEDSAAYSTAVENDLLYFIYDGVNEPVVVKQDGVTYCVLNDGAIAISFDESVTSLVIPATVEGIPVVELRETFKKCKKLTSVTLPDGLITVGADAFLYCTGLTSISIPDSVTTIGSSAFSYCSGLTSVDIGSGVTLIDAGAFSRCTKLTEITIPDGVTHIGITAFYYCTGLTAITIPDSVTDIGGLAFQDCYGLVSVTIPDNVLRMGNSAFSGCRKLTTVKIGDGLKKISDKAFYNCVSLTSVVIGNSITTIGSSAFSGCTEVRQVIIPDSVTKMNQNSFATNTILMVYENSYAHTFAVNNNLLYFVIRKTENPEISYGAEIAGTVTYTDGTAASGATVEILYDDGAVKETVIADSTGAYAITYAEVGRYSIRVTDTAGNSASSLVSIKRMNAFDVFLAGDTNLTLKKGWTISGTVSDGAATVTITDINGNVLDSVETTDGSFSFTDIPNGTYIIKAETENGIATQEITVFDGAVSDILLTVATQNVTIWGYVEVEDREYNHHRRNWVQVSIYNADGTVVAQTKSDKDGMYRFEKLPVGQYSIVAETAEMRPDKHHHYNRSHTLTGYAYVDAAAAGEYQADDIVLYEENDSLATISGKVTANGENQACQVFLRNVFRHEVAQQTTGKNGKYTFTNIRDGLYFITAVTENEGMGYAVVAVRHGRVYGETDIMIRKADKIKDREERFHKDFDGCHDRDTALKHKDRIAEEKRFYDGLSEKEKKQLSKEYVEHLNRMCQWIAQCEYVTDEGVTVEQGGLVISGDELENEDTISFEINVEKTDAWTANTDGIQEEKDFIYHDMHDKAGKGQIKQYYEISMTKTVDGQTKQITSVTKDTDATGKFRITMEIPEEYRGHKHYTMLHVHNGETVTLADLDDDPNTITFEVERFSTFALTGTDEILVPVAGASIWQDAELYGNYVSVEEALTAYDSATQYVRLTCDTAVALSLTQDLYIDLNGYDLSGTIATNGYKIYGMDSATNEYTCDQMGYFTCVDENGNAIVPETVVATTEEMTGNVMRYLCIDTQDGYTFHRFYLGITNLSLVPSVTGFGYKAEFYGDSMVQSKIASVGYNLWITEDVVVHRSTTFRNNLTLRLKNMDAARFGETPINACVTISLLDGTVIESATASYTLRQVVEAVNVAYAAFDEAQLSAVGDMIAGNLTMQAWSVENIYKPEAV